MRVRAAQTLEKFRQDDRLVFYVVSVLFALCLCFVSLFGDDTAFMYLEHATVADCFDKAVSLYDTWSSRVLVNFTVFFFTSRSSIVWWALFSGVSLYVLLWSIARLLPYRSRGISLFVTCMVMLYPFKDLMTAGWIATTVTYLAPTAFGFLSLVPIKKTLEGERLQLWEYVLYAAALLYGANNEQVMVLVMACYVFAMFYFLVKRKRAVFCLIQLVLSFASLLFVMSCPGNWERKQEEIARWFPTWGMFGTADKIDLGYTTTVHWVFFENNLFLIVIAILIAAVIWKQYRSRSLRICAVIPPLFMILFGPLKGIVGAVYPSAVKLADAIPHDGLVNAANRGNAFVFDVYLISSGLLLIIVVELLLCVKTWRSALTVLAFLLGGTASRMAIGFVPTIYASGVRTCTVMSFSLIFIACYLYAESVKEGLISKKEDGRILFTARILLILSMMNFLFLTAAVSP